MRIGILRASSAVLGVTVRDAGVGGWLKVDAVGEISAIIYLLLFIAG